MTRAATLGIGGALLAVVSGGALLAARFGGARVAPSPLPPPIVAAAVVPGAQTPPKIYSPDVVIDPPSINLHMLEPNEVKKVEFKVKNVSDKPIKIDSINTSCHCVQTDVDAKPIAPGESAVVRVTINAATAEAKKAIVTVYTSGMRRNIAQFELEYAVIPEVLPQPRVADFGRPRIGDKAEVALKVVLHLPRELAEDPVLEPYVALRDLPIRVTLDPPVVNKIREDTRDLTQTIRLVLDTSKQLAAFDTNIVFRPKAERTYRLSVVRLLGEVRGAAWFEHPQLAFGPAPIGKPTVFSIRLCGDGPDAPKLEEATISPAVFTEKHEVEADRHCVRFDLTCTPTEPGPVKGELVVRVASLAEPLKLPLSALGRQ